MKTMFLGNKKGLASPRSQELPSQIVWNWFILMCGDQTQVSSLGGLLYFITFSDDATRNLWLYCIKCKSDVFDILKK